MMPRVTSQLKYVSTTLTHRHGWVAYVRQCQLITLFPVTFISSFVLLARMTILTSWVIIDILPIADGANDTADTCTEMDGVNNQGAYSCGFVSNLHNTQSHENAQAHFHPQCHLDSSKYEDRICCKYKV